MIKSFGRTITSILLVVSMSSTNAVANTLHPDFKALFKFSDCNDFDDFQKNKKLFTHRGFSRVQVALIENNKKNKNSLIIEESEDLYSLLGMTEKEYIDALSNGKTLKGLLEDKGKVEDYKNLLLNNYILLLESSSMSDDKCKELIDKYKEFLESDNVFAFEKKESQSNNIITIEKKESESDEVLDLLNMSYQEYKTELRKGENLITLVNKADKYDEYKELSTNNYKKIIQNAVSNGALSSVEADNLMEKFLDVI